MTTARSSKSAGQVYEFVKQQLNKPIDDSIWRSPRSPGRLTGSMMIWSGPSEGDGFRRVRLLAEIESAPRPVLRTGRPRDSESPRDCPGGLDPALVSRMALFEAIYQSGKATLSESRV